MYLAWFALHAFFVITVSFQQTFWVLAAGYTSLPHFLESYWQEAEAVANAALAQPLSFANPLREGVNGYVNATGIEGGYGFFAPSVPDSYKIVFELHYPDGRVLYELPRVSDAATGVRLATLLDQLGRTDYEPLREIMIKMLVYSVWQDHPDATAIRAVLGFVSLPTIERAKNGETESYHFLYAYDFSFGEHSGANRP